MRSRMLIPGLVSLATILLACLASVNLTIFASAVASSLALWAVWLLHQRQMLASTLVALAPFLSRFEVSIAGVTIRPEMVVGLACWAAVALGANRGRRLRRSQVLIAVLLTLWVALQLVISYFQSPQFFASARVITWLCLSFGIAVWLWNSPIRTHRVMKASAWLALVYSVAAVALWGSSFLGYTGFGLQPDPAYGGYAAYVTVLEANILAGLVVLVTLLVFTPAGREVSDALRYTLLTLAPVVALATHTRTALIALAIGVLLLSIRYAEESTLVNRIYVGALAIASSVVLTVSDLSYGGLQKFTELINFETGTGGYRRITWELALNDLSANSAWVTGLGTNSFEQRHIDFSRPQLMEPLYLSNIFMQVIYDSGVLGVIILSLLAVVAIRASRSFSFVAVVAGYLVLAAATSVFWLAQTWIIVGIMLGYGSSQTSGWGPAHKQQPSVKGRLRTNGGGNQETFPIYSVPRR